MFLKDRDVYIAKRGSYTDEFFQPTSLSHLKHEVHLRLITATF